MFVSFVLQCLVIERSQHNIISYLLQTYIIIQKLMLATTLRIATLFKTTSTYASKTSFQPPQIRYYFTKDNKQGPTHDNHHEHEKGHKHNREMEQDHHKDTQSHTPDRPAYNPKQSHHVHGPGCKHDHHHPNEHDHHQANPQVKLSKLTFEQLIQLQTNDSLKYAHLIYEEEDTKLKQLQQQQRHLLKNLEFYIKLEEELEEKEQKLTQNIRICEEETELASKRAQKQIEESKDFAVTKIAKELLEVADSVTNCHKLADKTQSKDKYTEMVKQSHQLIKHILKRFEIEEFDPTGQEYNPNSQESLLHIPLGPQDKPNHVATTLRTGYTIKGRLLRSARVVVFH